MFADHVSQLAALVRRVMEPGGVTLGNVHFWIDDSGPYAGQVSYSIPTEQWDVAAVTDDLTDRLTLQEGGQA